MQVPGPYQSQVAPTVTGQPRANESAPLENFGGGRAAEEASGAVQGLLKTTNDIYVEQKRAADNAVGQDVYARLTQKKNDLIYNPKSGAMTKKGQDALNVVNDFGKQFDDYSNDVASTLQNDDQRRQFEHFKRVVGDELNGQLTRYTYGESQNLQTEIANTALQTAKDDAILNYHEPGKIQESLDLQDNLIRNSLSKQGLPSEVIDQKVAAAKSSTLSGVIDRMLVNGQDSQAKEFYDQHKDRLTATDAVAVEKSLESGSMRGESQKKADEITNSTDSLSSALEKSRAIEDPKLRDETTRRVKEFFQDKQQAQKLDSDNRFNSASQIIENNGGNLDQIPPQMMANMSSAERHALESRSTQIKNGVEPASNGEDFYNLQQMAVTPELRDKFLGLNLLQYRHQVTQNEMSELMKIQASMRKSDGEADDTVRGLRTRTQVVNETIKAAGLDKDPEAQLTINRMVDDQIQQFNVNTGKKPNGQEIQKMVDNIIVKTKDPNSGLFGFFNTAPAFRQNPNSSLEVNVSDIPVSEKNEIVKALTARNIPVTDQKIEELYARKLNGMRQRGK